MKELPYADGTIVIDDRIAEAIDNLASALTDSGMSAWIRISPVEKSIAIEIDMGHSHTHWRNHVHARPVTGKASHLDIEEL